MQTGALLYKWQNKPNGPQITIHLSFLKDKCLLIKENKKHLLLKYESAWQALFDSDYLQRQLIKH